MESWHQLIPWQIVNDIRVYTHLGPDHVTSDHVQASGPQYELGKSVLVYGGDGNDFIIGTRVNDELHGGAGNDTIRGHRGDDLIFGDDGDDVLIGDWTGQIPLDEPAGNDTIYGGNGADEIHADWAAALADGYYNTVPPHGGWDLLDGGDGEDELWGEPGNDRYVISDENASVFDSINETPSSGGQNVFAFSEAGAGTHFQYGTGSNPSAVDVLADGVFELAFEAVQPPGGVPYWKLTKSGTGNVSIGNVVNVATPVTFYHDAGLAKIYSNLGAPAVRDSNGVIIQAAKNPWTVHARNGSTIRFYESQNLAELHVTGGSGAVMFDDGSNALVTNLLEVQTASGSYVDLRSNDLIVQNGAQKDYVRALFISGHNGIDANFISRWDGPGIRSSWVREQNLIKGYDLYGLGGIKNGDLSEISGSQAMYTTFTGQAVDANSILVKTTYSGDANLDGLVSFDDYGYIDSGFFGLIDPEVYGWLSGDFDHDGDVDYDDYALIDQAFYDQLGQM
jgi:hypothetical protein